jgi:hypothetical protein
VLKTIEDQVKSSEKTSSSWFTNDIISGKDITVVKSGNTVTSWIYPSIW